MFGGIPTLFLWRMFGGIPTLFSCRQTVGIVGSRLARETARVSVRMFGVVPTLMHGMKTDWQKRKKDDERRSTVNWP
jgi:hypothetical protein